jgi:hypothetical protein
MKANVLWVSLSIVVIAIASAYWFLPGRGVNTRTVRTIQLMQNIFIDFDLLQEADVNTLAQSVQGVTNALELNRACAAFFTRSTDPYITNSAGYLSVDGLYCDAWGIPLWFAVTNTSMYGRLNPQLKEGKGTPFVIWSSGSNQTNDFGFGDDLFLHR